MLRGLNLSHTREHKPSSAHPVDHDAARVRPTQEFDLVETCCPYDENVPGQSGRTNLMEWGRRTGIRCRKAVHARVGDVADRVAQHTRTKTCY